MNKFLNGIGSVLKAIFVRPFTWYFGLTIGKKIWVGLLSFFLFIISLLLLPVVLFYSVSTGMLGAMPSDADLLAIKNYQASEVYSADSVLLGRYFVQNRSDATYSEVTHYLFDAIIATEDARFYKHEGIDTKSLLRVLFKSVILGKNTGGGSTISQQLAKNLFGRKNYGWLTMPVIKIREGIIANQLERLYSKKEILMLYVNTISFGEDTYGITTASQRFFNKTPDKLNIEEAAVLAGALKSPTFYNPRKNPENALRRRNIVLTQLEKYNYITADEYRVLIHKPLLLDYTKLDNSEGIAPYFRDRLKEEVEKILPQYKKADGSVYNLYTDGLKIYTTIHSRLQSYAEDAVTAHLKRIQPLLEKDLKRQAFFDVHKKIVLQEIQMSNRYKVLAAQGLSAKEILNGFQQKDSLQINTLTGQKNMYISPMDSVKLMLSSLQAGVLVVDPHTGSVLAWVGGANFKQVQYDHILAQRQAGSVFKPIVYAQALKSGVQPCDFIANQKVTYTQYDDWTPENSSERENGRYSMAGALANSINTISVDLCMQAGISNVIALAKSLGINSDLPAKPSIALGTAEMSLWDLTGAYTAFANNGNKATLKFITSIVDDQGVLIMNVKASFKNIFTKEQAHTMTNMLRNVVDKGTAHELRDIYGLRGSIAAKTGTTQDHKDGWFMGYTSGLLGGVWVGADNPAIHFSAMNQGRGAATAMPIWAGLYKRIASDPELRYLVTRP
ncbi:MAG TPA: transglycosylase domain-containing protein, partial [Cytophaga sp.]|nr:transglycosylase domain-containing protein [Cytophaga sp.]